MTVERDKTVNISLITKDTKRLSAELIGQRNSSRENRTRLPSIESAKRHSLIGETFGVHSNVDVEESTSSRAQRSESGMYRNRSSGAVVRVDDVDAKRLRKPNSASRYKGLRGIDLAVEDKTSCEKTTERRHSEKFYREPLQCADVDLKSSLPKLCGQSSLTHQTDSQINTSESWEPFSCTCRYCGLKFGKHSILIHEKRCSIKQQKPSLSNETATTSSDYIETPVARIVTIGLGGVQCEQLTVHAYLPARPETRTLRHSSLRDSGFGLPYVPSASNHCSNTNSVGARTGRNEPSGHVHGVTLCDHCGRVVTADRVNVHSRLCKPDILQQLSTTSVSFPLTRNNLLKVEQENHESRQPRMAGKNPPTVVCYICGREYGTKSIAIHEPQCLKKFETENRKLPINKRKPLPKKRSEERAKVVQLIAKEDQILAVSGQPTELTDERMDLVFQQCYADFERELVPCKRCGRKFAPERHQQHEPKCNATPLRYHKPSNLIN